MAKKVIEVKIDEQNVAPVVQTKAQFQGIMDAYAKQNPRKFALKQKALEAKLDTLPE